MDDILISHPTLLHAVRPPKPATSPEAEEGSPTHVVVDLESGSGEEGGQHEDTQKPVISVKPVEPVWSLIDSDDSWLEQEDNKDKEISSSDINLDDFIATSPILNRLLKELMNK